MEQFLQEWDMTTATADCIGNSYQLMLLWDRVVYLGEYSWGDYILGKAFDVWCVMLIFFVCFELFGELVSDEPESGDDDTSAAASLPKSQKKCKGNRVANKVAFRCPRGCHKSVPAVPTLANFGPSSVQPCSTTTLTKGQGSRPCQN